MDLYSESDAEQKSVDDEAALGMSKSTESAEGVPCSHMEQDTEFVGETKVIVRNMLHPSECCAKCRQVGECRAWALDASTNECKLKWLPPTATITKVRRSGVTSGLPFRWDRPHSILCVSLFRPGSYEEGLLKWQYENSANIFACDEWSVYSSKPVVLAKGLQANVIDSDLQCKMGGEFGTALNTEIFFKLWDRIFTDARYFYHEWLVKTDPDSVFFADRLRYSVANHHDEPGGVYLNNCKFGLHGPIEVFSKNAVEKWRTGRQWCVDFFSKKCNGMCLWGEDLFIDQCLWKVIKVKRINDWNLISEAHCDSWDWPECRNGRIVFHPFKDVETYEKCWRNGQSRPLPFSNGSMTSLL
jgi:hypothetical protein